ncbi:MAG: nickel-type superoxide dismutase maturation protease [Actinobacteria bacterium]|nr:nickel-type superoxide dismutase maturation protease [Actinomycetota bacterium]
MIAVLGAACVLVRWRPFRVEVAGRSMRPTLEPGDWALAIGTGRGRLPRIGDIVVLEHPDRPEVELVKRVTDVRSSPMSGATELWVEGDDPAASTDSRHFGPVHGSQVRGRVVLVWWPPSRRRLL